jgi:enoyl-CoA hydratase
MNTKYVHLSIEIRNHILVLTINRPQVLNALSFEVLRELADVVAQARNNTEVKGIILTGAGDKSFVAGADIEELSKMTLAEADEFSCFGQQVFMALERFPKPVIAAVNGFALGGGCELAMACHLRIASAKAKFSQPEINLGLIPGFGGTQRLTHLVGRGKAMELIMTGEIIKADQALSLGLVNSVVEPEELLPTAFALMDKFLTKSPLALAYTIQSVNAAIDATSEEGYAIEARLFAQIVASKDGKEGTSAFLAKRTPVFKGQ